MNRCLHLSAIFPIFSVLLCLPPIVPVDICAAQDTFTIEEIATKIQESRQSVQQFYIDYTFSHVPDEQLTRSSILKMMDKGGSQKFGFSGPMRSNSLALSFYGDEHSSQSTLRVFDGETHYARDDKRVEITSLRSGSLDLCPYLNVLLWPMSNADFQQIKDQPPEKVPFLPRMLEGKWSVADKLVMVNGYECCHLVEEDGSRQLFLAPTMNFALVKYIFAGEKTGQSFGNMVCEGTSFRSFDGVFFPMSVRASLEIFDPEKKTLGGVWKTHHQVNEIAINGQVPAALFEFAINPGDIVFNADTGEIRRESAHQAGYNPFEFSLIDARGQVPLQNSYFKLIASNRLMIWIAVSALIGFITLPLCRILRFRGRSTLKVSLLLILALLAVVHLPASRSFAQQASDSGADVKDVAMVFDDIFEEVSGSFFHLDFNGELTILCTSWRRIDSPLAVLDLLLNEEVSEQLELVPYQIADLTKVQKEVKDANDYAIEFLLEENFWELRKQQECINKIVPAYNLANKAIEKHLLRHQRQELEKIMLIFHIRRLGLYSALTTGELGQAINCSAAQKARMEAILKDRDSELSKEFSRLRIDAVEQMLSLLDGKQQELWRSKFGEFEQIDRGFHSGFIEQFEQPWIDNVKRIDFRDDVKRYPQYAGIVYNCNFAIGLDGRPRFSADSIDGRPQGAPIFQGLWYILLNRDVQSFLELDAHQRGKITAFKQSSLDFHLEQLTTDDELREKYGRDDKSFWKSRTDQRVTERSEFNEKLLEDTLRLLSSLQVKKLEGIARLSGLYQFGITFLLCHSDLRQELKISESQIGDLENKAKELSVSLRKDSAEIERKLNQELLAVLNSDQRAKFNSLTGNSLRLEGGLFDVQKVIRTYPEVLPEFERDQATIQRFLGKEPVEPESLRK